ISPTWFYDAQGSALFERLGETPEYYLTRTELGILRDHRVEIAAALGSHVALIEPGSGAIVKTRLLLDVLRDPWVYVPVDVARAALFAAAPRVREDYPQLRVQPVCADFARSFELPWSVIKGARRRVVYFPGSTIGNFERDEAVGLLRNFSRIVSPDGAVVLGIDRVKPAGLLQRAYDDAAGVTAAFNLNALRHLNAELGATFDLAAFEHEAIWDEARERIEMRLVARRSTRFGIGPSEFALGRGDYLLTEYSQKYSLDSVADIVAAAGFRIEQVWSDRSDWFSVLLLEPAG
ncbi:MAG: L-histidine N(alpha)-methyltransferase, partial [Steroidobacteraceae bacterium]